MSSTRVPLTIPGIHLIIFTWVITPTPGMVFTLTIIALTILHTTHITPPGGPGMATVLTTMVVMVTTGTTGVPDGTVMPGVETVMAAVAVMNAGMAASFPSITTAGRQAVVMFVTVQAPRKPVHVPDRLKPAGPQRVLPSTRNRHRVAPVRDRPGQPHLPGATTGRIQDHLLRHHRPGREGQARVNHHHLSILISKNP